VCPSATERADQHHRQRLERLAIEPTSTEGDVRSSGSVLLFLGLPGRREQSTEREILGPICGWSADPGIRGPVAHPAHDDLDIALAGGRPKLVGAALRTPIRRVHNLRVRCNLPRSEDLVADRSHARLDAGPGTPGCSIPAGWPSGLGRGLQSPAHRFDSGPRLHDDRSVPSARLRHDPPISRGGRLRTSATPPA
jgi:hypothetical protein